MSPADASEAPAPAPPAPAPAPQLTARAVAWGMAIGAVMCLSNLYVFFKTGWSLGVTLTACILAFSVFKALAAARVARPLGALENNALTTVASGAGYMTGGGNMAAFGALLMITSVRPDPPSMIAWFGVIAALGVFVAIPLKRQLIDQDALPFPTGTATAETIRSLHADDGVEAVAGAAPSEGSQKARALVVTGAIAGALAWLRDAHAAWMPFNLPATIPLPFTLAGRALKDWTLVFKTEVVLLGAGALMSFRTAWSLLLGGLMTYALLAPALFNAGIITFATPKEAYKAIVAWTLWPGAALLVASGVTSFVLDWRSVARSFTGLAQMFQRGKPAAPVEGDEAPEAWFPLAMVVLGPIVVVLMAWLFQIPWWAGALAVPLAVVMGFIAARVTGETDVTPTKALGPVTQLIYGVLTTGNLTGNIMSANVTGGIGLHAADLLTTLKTGKLLGASARQQVLAQLFGVLAGAVVIVPAFNLLIPDAALLGGEEWPAPSCVVWAGVSKAFAGGLGSLPPSALRAAAVAALLGVVLALCEKLAPRSTLRFLPSPSGLGIAMVIPASNAIAMFIGAALAALARRWRPEAAARFTVPVASGFIAGESLVGIVIALLVVSGVLSR
jgi:putative OPT family oligopeptide transporter